LTAFAGFSGVADITAGTAVEAIVVEIHTRATAAALRTNAVRPSPAAFTFSTNTGFTGVTAVSTSSAIVIVRVGIHAASGTASAASGAASTGAAMAGASRAGLVEAAGIVASATVRGAGVGVHADGERRAASEARGAVASGSAALAVSVLATFSWIAYVAAGAAVVVADVQVYTGAVAAGEPSGATSAPAAGA
jgi:hypothetical protein